MVHQATSKCIDYEYAGFHCVPIFQCNDEGVIRINGGGPRAADPWAKVVSNSNMRRRRY